MAGETVLVIDDSPTILKVVQLVLTKAGFRVEIAPDGELGVTAARQVRPDLILLDFVMPRMNGYQVCRSLSADGNLRGIPVVLMSAKGDQVGERFVKVMGIVDYITKPFSPEAITAVVQHTIAKYAEKRLNEPGDADGRTSPLADQVGTEDTTSNGDAAVKAEGRRRTVGRVRERLAVRLGERVAALYSLADAAQRDQTGERPPGAIDAGLAGDLVPTDPAAVADAVRGALDDDFLADVAREIEQLATGAGPATGGGGAAEASLRGDVRVVPIAEVLQLLDAQKQSGLLEVERSEVAVEVCFRNGRVDLATSRNLSEEYLLGRFIVEGGTMSQADLEGFLESRVPGSKLIGAQLVKLGYLSEQDLKAALSRQTRELVYEILRWSFGSFRFTRTRDLPPAAVDAMLALEVEGILMEGFRRVDEWHLIEREVNDFETVFLRNEDAVAQMGRGRLTREELAVLELVNGKNTVKDIVRASRMGSFDVSKMLYRLLSIKLIRRRVMPVAV